MRKPKAYPNDALAVQEETLETRIAEYSEKRMELKNRTQEFRESVSDLKECIKGLENIIKAEVMEKKQTVTVGNVRIEYVPTVVIKMKKEKNNGE